MPSARRLNAARYRRRAAPTCRRLSGMLTRVALACSADKRAEEDAALSYPAARSCAKTLKATRDECGQVVSQTPRPEPTTLVAPTGLRSKLRARQETRRCTPSCYLQRPHRNQGRGLAACRTPRLVPSLASRCSTFAPAGGWQDTGARGADGQQGPALRHRRRQRRLARSRPDRSIRARATSRFRRPKCRWGGTSWPTHGGKLDLVLIEQTCHRQFGALEAQSGRQMAGPAGALEVSRSRSRR